MTCNIYCIYESWKTLKFLCIHYFQLQIFFHLNNVFKDQWVLLTHPIYQQLSNTLLWFTKNSEIKPKQLRLNHSCLSNEMARFIPSRRYCWIFNIFHQWNSLHTIIETGIDFHHFLQFSKWNYVQNSLTIQYYRQILLLFH